MLSFPTTRGQILALPNIRSDPLSSSPYPSKPPHEDDKFPSLSLTCVQNFMVFSGDKVECSSQGDSIILIQEENLLSSLNDLTI